MAREQKKALSERVKARVAEFAADMRRADMLSDPQPLASFWQRRALRMTGYRVYHRAA